MLLVPKSTFSKFSEFVTLKPSFAAINVRFFKSKNVPAAIHTENLIHVCQDSFVVSKMLMRTEEAGSHGT